MKTLILLTSILAFPVQSETITIDGANWQLNPVEVSTMVNEACSTSSDKTNCENKVYQLMGKVGRTYVALEMCDINKVNNVECKGFERVVDTIADKE